MAEVMTVSIGKPRHMTTRKKRYGGMRKKDYVSNGTEKIGPMDPEHHGTVVWNEAGGKTQKTKTGKGVHYKRKDMG